MQVEVKIDHSLAEPKITIWTSAITEEVNRIVDQLSKEAPQLITGIRNEKIEVIRQESLVRVYASAGKVLATTDQGEYILRPRLYEMEERLNSSQFVRISNSEIINLKKVKSFDLSLSGTICVELANGTKAYVSRRYVPKIKAILGI